MKVKNYVRMTAGSLVFLSSLLGYFHNKYWLFLTMFVGLNLFQYGITGFCPLVVILKRLGVKE